MIDLDLDATHDPQHRHLVRRSVARGKRGPRRADQIVASGTLGRLEQLLPQVAALFARVLA